MYDNEKKLIYTHLIIWILFCIMSFSDPFIKLAHMQESIGISIGAIIVGSLVSVITGETGKKNVNFSIFTMIVVYSGLAVLIIGGAGKLSPIIFTIPLALGFLLLYFHKPKKQ